MKERKFKIYVILVIVFISIGVVYAALTTSFSMSGTINVPSATYNVTYSGSNASFSSDSTTIIFGSTTTNKITPVTGYYLKSLSCTNGYTTNATTGTGATAAQTVTIKNNKNASNSACTATMSNIYYASITGNNTTSSTSNLSIPYNSSSTIEVTPKTGYYFTTASCTNGYTIEGLVSGKGNTSPQTLTINNNANAKDSVCTISSAGTYLISMTGSNATYASQSQGQITYGSTTKITLTPTTGYWLSNISCTNGYTASGNMGPNKSGSAVQDITIKNNNNANDTKCTVTMSRFYPIYMFGTNVTFSEQNLSVVYRGSTMVTVTPNAGYYLKSLTCEEGLSHNAKTGTSASASQTITITNNVLSTASCTATVELLPECDYEVGQTWTYTYDSKNKGSKQFSVPCAGNYKLEVTSGRGGTPGQRVWVEATTGNYQCAVEYTLSSGLKEEYYPGKASGEFRFNKDQILYIVPGGNGGTGYIARPDAAASGCGDDTKGSAGYNGGLAGNAAGVSGSGGVTHIALADGLYNDLTESNNLLISARSGARYKFSSLTASTYEATGAGENYVNTSSSFYNGGMSTVDSTKENFGTAIITYLGP